MIGDVSVVGLVPETVPLPDIGMDVPHGVVVRIPADKACNSKDLWRAISQRRVFRLQGWPAANPSGPSLPPVIPEETQQLQRKLVAAEREVVELRAALSRKDQELMQERGKFDEILGLLRRGVPSLPAGEAAPRASVAQAQGVVEVETPSFIPSTIRVDPTESRMTVDEGASEGGAVSGARSALRKFRRNE